MGLCPQEGSWTASDDDDDDDESSVVTLISFTMNTVFFFR